jgi:transcriptional regulator with XRE-family HTH domain
MDYQAMHATMGQKFTELRKMADRTQTETALLLKKPLSTYIRLEQDFIYPTESFMRKVAKLYNITRKELLAIGEP